MRSISAATVAAWVAHALAWAAGLWLAFWPVYQGESATATAPGEPLGETVRFTSTLIEQNGLWVVSLLLAPIVLTAVALLALRLTDDRWVVRKVLLWGPAALLLGFCVLGILSIGFLYLPAALALLVAAFLDLGGRDARPEAT